MIYYLMLLCMPLVASCQSIAQKQYNIKCEKPNVILFSSVTSFIALCFFLITSRLQLTFDARLVPYSLGFAVCYACAWIGTVLAVRYGSIAISNLIVSCSLIFPTALGVLLGEPLTARIVIGVVLLLCAIVLVNVKKGGKEKFSLKWFACVMVAFFGNGCCSIMSNLQKRTLGDAYTHEFMIIALLAAAVLLLICAVATSKNVKADFKACLPYSASNGIANAVLNFMTLTIIGNIPNTVFYPTNSALNMLCAFLLGYFAYKERFGKLQYVGYALGAVTIVMLNL